MNALKSLLAFFLRHKRRVAPAVLVIGAVFVASQLFGDYPREVELNYALGPDHDRIVGLELSYEQGGEAVAGAVFTWPGGAPSRLHHEVELAPGRWRVRADIRAEGAGTRTVTRAFEVPADGIVTVDLFSRAYASLDRAPDGR